MKSSIHELEQYLYVDTPLGSGVALMVIDYGPQVNTTWVIAIEETGEIKHFDSNQIRLCYNDTFEINTKRK